MSEVKVIDPPRATAEPLIVICPEPCNAAFATEVFGKAIFAPLGTVIVSPLSPSCTPVPDLGLILFTFTSLIIILL